MSADLLQLMLLKDLLGKDKGNLLQDVDAFEKWMNDRKEKDKLKPKPTMFSPLQTFLFIAGLGPALGMAASIGWIHLMQQLLDAVRTLH